METIFIFGDLEMEREDYDRFINEITKEGYKVQDGETLDGFNVCVGDMVKLVVSRTPKEPIGTVLKVICIMYDLGNIPEKYNYKVILCDTDKLNVGYYYLSDIKKIIEA